MNLIILLIRQKIIQKVYFLNELRIITITNSNQIRLSEQGNLNETKEDFKGIFTTNIKR